MRRLFTRLLPPRKRRRALTDSAALLGRRILTLRPLGRNLDMLGIVHAYVEPAWRGMYLCMCVCVRALLSMYSMHAYVELAWRGSG